MTTGLNALRRDHFQWNDLPTEFHNNLIIGSEVIRGETDRLMERDRLLISQVSLSLLRNVG
jgi:hypothetical protein